MLAKGDDRLTIHRAVHARSTVNSWSPVDLTVVIYRLGNKIFASAYATAANRYYSRRPPPIAHIAREVSTTEEAASFAMQCLDNPSNILFKSKAERSAQSRFAEQLDSLEIVSNIDGSEGSLPGLSTMLELTKTRKLPVSLALGQHLVSAISAQKTHSREIREILKYYITHVPLTVGHWGPFKSIFKILEKMDDAQELYGLAVARIDSLVINQTGLASQTENLEFLWPLFTTPVASNATFSYLSRRGRRVFKRLSKAKPEEYVKSAQAFLVSADALGGQLDVSLRRTMAEVLYGRGVSDSSHGKGALNIPPQPARFNRRWDRSPDEWNKHIKLVASLWSKSERISDIQVWAFNVLKSQKVPLPSLTRTGLRLALVSLRTAVRKEACSQIADQPKKFLHLDASSSVAFLNFSSEKQFRKVLTVLESNKPSQAIHEAIASFLNSNGMPAILRGQRPAGLSGRTEKLLSYFFRHCQGGLTEIGALNLGMFIGETNGFKPSSLWRASLESLPIKTLIELRLNLTGISTSAKKTIDDACRIAFRADQDENLAMALVHSPTKALRDLAWAMLSSDQVTSETQIGTWRSLLDFSGSKDGLIRLRECVMNKTRFATLLSHPESASVLGKIAIVLATTERSSSKLALYSLRDAGDPLIVLETLEIIAGTCQSWALEQERSLLTALIVKSDNVREFMWNGMSEGRYEHLAHKLADIPTIIKAFIDVIKPEEIISVLPAQATILSNMLTAGPAQIVRSRDLSVALATCPASDVASKAISILEARDKIKTIFTPLLESRLPIAMGAAQRYLETVSAKNVLTKAIISVCDSGVREAREQGLSLLVNRHGEYDVAEVYSALAEHKSPEVAAEVAHHMLHNGQIRPSVVKNFDKRILRTRRESRKAKELVKQRLDRSTGPGVTPISSTANDASERIDSILALARGRSQRDREWALRELVRLSELGTNIPGFQTSRTT